MHAKIQTINDRNDKMGFNINQNDFGFGHIEKIQKDDVIHFIVGMEKADIYIEDIRFIGGKVRKAVQGNTVEPVLVDFPRLVSQCGEISEADVVTAFMEGWYLAGYQFLSYKKEEPQEKVDVEMETELYKGYAAHAKTRSNAVNTARDLCNEPANKLTPAVYAERLKDIFMDTNVGVEIIETNELMERGFEAIATVGKGSSHPPKLAVLTLHTNREGKKISLVGKGVTFDSGGTNVKTGGDIGEMKMDMGGSAAVVGAMKLLADTGKSVHVTAILPLVENVSGGNAFLPSDVIKYRNGMTVEVGNTDAEGRLVLADGILYAQSLGAETIIDIATLTGTIGQALGLKVAGIFSNDEKRLFAYKEMGDHSGDPVWPMPVIDDYQCYLQSDSADINNRSTSKFGGAITAALFLKNFIEKGRKWIHIDMANTVRPWKVEGYYVPGASGFGVRLLTELIDEEIC